MAERVVEVEDLWLRYRDGDWVLRGLNLSVLQGEVVLVVGSSGSGKTSLAKALTGLAPAVLGAEVRGRIEVCFRPINSMDEVEVQRCIQVVNQDPYTHFLEPIALDDLVSYAEKFYGGEALGAVEKIARLMNIEHLLEKPITSLSCGQLKRLTIAKALIADPRVVVLDEPLMWLDDVDGVELISSVISLLRGLGKAAVIMEHRFLHLLNKVDKIYSLKSGRMFEVKELEKARVGVADRSPAKSVATPDPDGVYNVCEPSVELKNLWFRYDGSPSWILKGVDLRVCRGDTVIVYGPNGSGKSTLLRIIAGVLKPSRGSRRVYRRVLYVPQVPYLFITEDSILNEVREVCNAKRLGGDCIREGLELLSRFGYVDVDALPLNLSWGQQTRLATLIAYIASRDGVILLDEPFTGSSYLDSFNLVQLLSAMGSATKIISLSSKDYIPLFKSARVYILRKGRLESFAYDDDRVMDGVRFAQEILH